MQNASFQLRLATSAAAASATFLASARVIELAVWEKVDHVRHGSFGLFGSAGTCAKAPVLIINAAHIAPNIKLKRRILFLPSYGLPGTPGFAYTTHLKRADRN